MPFDQFASLDQDVVTENQMTQNDAERVPLESVKSLESQASPQENEVNEPTPLTPIQATDAVKAIGDFVIT